MMVKTPLHIASSNRPMNERTHIIKLLLRNGANMSMKTRDDKTAEDIAHEKGYDETVDCIQHFIEMRRQSFAWLKRRRQRQLRSV